jgi:hypothetical protein
MDGEHIDSYLDVDGSCGVQYVFVTWKVLMVMIHKVKEIDMIEGLGVMNRSEGIQLIIGSRTSRNKRS